MEQDGGSQVDRCYRMLRDMIVTCKLAPGTRLNEREIIERLGAGRTPVREALLRLDQDRLIDTLPRSGYRVRPVTRKGIVDFFAVWRSLAPLIVSLGVPRLTAADRDAIAAIGRGRAVLGDDDTAGLSRTAGDFFEILVKATDNEPLIFIYRRLGAEMERIFQIFFETSGGRDWIGSGSDISAFARVTNAESAARRVIDRVAASERGVLAHFPEDRDVASPD